MQLRRILFAAALAVAHLNSAASNPLDQAICENTDEELCGHTSLLQTSVKITKSEMEATEEIIEWQGHSLASLSILTSAHGSRSDAQNHTAFFLANALLLICIVAFVACMRQEAPTELPEEYKPASEQSQPDEALMRAGEEMQHNKGFDEDVYMMSVCVICRDWHKLSKETPIHGARNSVGRLPAVRIAYAAFLLFFTLGMQITLVWCTKVYVTPQQVAAIRDNYNSYEIHMYGGEKNTRMLDTGKRRGLPEHFQPALFETLDDDVKGDVCQIPFSQLKFLVFILLIWSVTCIAQISRCVRFMWNFLVMLPTVPSMMDAIVRPSKVQPRARWTIVGLTVAAKLAMLFFIFLPWLGSTCFLCWLGCRWLAATNDFGNLLSNAMALEFILQFKSLMYFAVVSERTKRDVQCTRFAPPAQTEKASYFGYFNTLVWGAISVAWVYVYIFHLQRVLPEYQWDIHEPCTPFITGMLNPSAE